MSSANVVLVAALLLSASVTARAQSVADGSDSAIGAEKTRAVLALVAQRFREPEARVTALREGRAGALCGAVDVRNRMGAYTGPRGFVSDLADGFIERLPEGPELRSPGSMAAFRAMERAKTLFAANCTIE